MQTIAVFVNDVAAARRVMQPLLEGSAAPTRWIVVACPPVLTRHIGRWVSQAARRQWRERFGAELFAALVPALARPAGAAVETIVATRPLIAVAARLQARWPGLQLLDARQARVGRTDEPIVAGQPVPRADWTAPAAATAGLTLMLTLAD